MNQEIEEYKDRIETLEGLLRRIVEEAEKLSPLLTGCSISNGYLIRQVLLEEVRKVVGDGSDNG